MSPMRNILLSLSRIPPAVMLLVIVGLAVVVTLSVNNLLDSRDKAAKERTEAMDRQLNQKGKVVVATKDIAEGEVISASNLEERELPVGKVPEDAITSASLVAGRVSKYGITSNQIVSQHDLSTQGSGTTYFEDKVRAGSRAITFAVDNNSGVAGFITPDSHIDVLSMVGNGADTKAAPILSDIRVVAVGQLYQKNPSGAATPASSLTVAVTPEEAQKLVKAISASKIYVSLRNGNDHTPVATMDVTQMYKKESSKSLISSLDGLPPLSKFEPPPLAPVGAELPASEGVVPGVQPMRHEIELWEGSKKDIMTVPKD